MKLFELVVSIVLQLHQISTKLDEKQKSFIKGIYLPELCFFTHPLVILVLFRKAYKG